MSENLQQRIQELLESNTREVEKRREAERSARISATTTRLYQEKFDNIAELVALKDERHVYWIEPDDVTETVAQALADKVQLIEKLESENQRLRGALNEAQWCEPVYDGNCGGSSKIIGYECPLCGNNKDIGVHCRDCVIGAALTTPTEGTPAEWMIPGSKIPWSDTRPIKQPGDAERKL